MAKTNTRANQRTTNQDRNTKTTLSLADKLFAITTRNYENSAEKFLPKKHKNKLAIHDFQRTHKETLTKLEPITTASLPIKETEGKLLTLGRTVARRTMVVMARAALFIIAISAGLTLISYIADDSIRIEDERGKNALNNEIRAKEKAVSLNVMRKRKKIGEFTVAKGSRLRIVKATNGDTFRPEVAFTGESADFKLKYKGKTALIVTNGPFHAKVKIAQGANNDVHLRFKETGTLLPVGEPEFSIEVVKGDVQIAETDDNVYEEYKTGEQAVFTLSSSDSGSENL
ncbi:MAG TPA: hypothetical protein PLY93_00830 [Turneriella sp.]|nr:hypothetical protein [Turneriella sp.]